MEVKEICVTFFISSEKYSIFEREKMTYFLFTELTEIEFIH